MLTDAVPPSYVPHNPSVDSSTGPAYMRRTPKGGVRGSQVRKALEPRPIPGRSLIRRAGLRVGGFALFLLRENATGFNSLADFFNYLAEKLAIV